jgi:hypothetical protein
LIQDRSQIYDQQKGRPVGRPSKTDCEQSALVHCILDEAGNDLQHDAANAATDEVANHACAAVSSCHAKKAWQKRAAAETAKGTSDGVAETAKVRVLEDCATSVAANETCYSLQGE